MKKIAFILFSAVLVPAGLCLAQPAGPGPHGPGGPGGKGPAGPPHGKFMLGMFDRVAKELPEKLEFTPEQKEKFSALTQKHRANLEELIKKLEQEKKSFETDLNGILTPEQQAKLKELQKAREMGQKRFQEGMKGLGQGPEGRPGRMSRALKELNLSPEKNEKVMAIVNDYKAKFQDAPKGDRQARQQIMKEMMGKIRETLAPEEFQQLKEILHQQRGPMGRGPGRGGPGGPEGRGPGGNRACPPEKGPAEPPPPPAGQEENPF